MPQAVTFLVDGEAITVSHVDAERIVAALLARPDAEAKTAADRIQRAIEVGASNTIDLGLIEDDEVLAVLADFEESDGLSDALARLDRALRGKIERGSQ
jgi:hypothetical protein